MLNLFNSVEDFIADESFQNYILHRDGASIARWESYQKNHPEHQDLLLEASHFLTLLSPQPLIVDVPKRNKHKKYLYIFGLIGCCAILFSIWFFSLSANVAEASFITRTAESENLNIIFPDQTEVELRKGSTIQYLENWSETETRKVWLSGEAFFDVAKAKEPNDVFEVQLEYGLIKVLGTKFLVRSDQDKTNVILEEGRVDCLVGDQNIVMKPGDLLVCSNDKVSIEHLQSVRNYDSWRSGKLSFKNVSIEEVIKTINNSYAIDVSLGNPLLKNRKITATVDHNDPLLLLHAIADIYEMELIEKSKKLILK